MSAPTPGTGVRHAAARLRPGTGVILCNKRPFEAFFPNATHRQIVEDFCDFMSGRTGPYIKRFGVDGILRTLQGSGMNAAVIDLKDGEGRVLYDTKIEVLQAQKQVMIRDGQAMIRKLRGAGIYTIARIVCFSDPSLPIRHPERAIMDNRERRQGKVWASWGGRNTCLDP
jgi:ribosomal protein S9